MYSIQGRSQRIWNGTVAGGGDAAEGSGIGARSADRSAWSANFSFNYYNEVCLTEVIFGFSFSQLKQHYSKKSGWVETRPIWPVTKALVFLLQAPFSRPATSVIKLLRQC